MASLTGEVTELLQQLIRNRCVNDGTAGSGNEVRSAETLQSYLEGGGVEVERYEPFPGRGAVLARIEGSDPTAPSLMLMGHLDVVPVREDAWERDPFGGEVVDGVVWGRGAVDMLNTTSSMAVAFKRLASEQFRPRGTLTYFGCPDEEALGIHGAKWFTENEPSLVRADYVLTEYGGVRLPFPTERPAYPVMVGEKGTYWSRLRVHGTPAHASMPYRTDNAVVKAAEVVGRLASYRPPARLSGIWTDFVHALGLPADLRDAMLDIERLEALCEALPVGLARTVHSCTHTTIAPTILHGGVKTNIIPAAAELQLDVRTAFGETAEETRSMLREALGDLADEVEVVEDNPFEASSSPSETPLWDVLSRITRALVPQAVTVPFMIVGATDARYFRKLGCVCYGYGLLSERIPMNEFAQMFHGDNERVDQESLRLSAELWMATAREFLGG